MDLQKLAARCREETEKFKNNRVSDPTYCLTLWRIALGGATIGDRNAALHYVYAQYTPQICNWFDAHGLASQIKQRSSDAVDFAHTVWVKVLEENEKSPIRVDSLQQVLAFVRQCLIWEILMAARHHGRHIFLPLTPDLPLPSPQNVEEDVGKRVYAREVWNRLCECAREFDGEHYERNVRLMDLRWVQKYTPAQIVAQFPGQFPKETEIYLILAKIKARYKQKYGLEW